MPSQHPKVERKLNGIVMLFFFGISLKISCNYLDDFVKGIISTHIVSAYPFLTKFMPAFLLGWEKAINIFKRRREWFGTSNVVVKPPSIRSIVVDGVLCLWSLCTVGYPFYSFIFVDDDAFSQLNKYMAGKNETVGFNAPLVLGLQLEIVEHVLMGCGAFIQMGVIFTSFITNVRNKLYWPATHLCTNDLLQDHTVYVKLFFANVITILANVLAEPVFAEADLQQCYETTLVDVTKLKQKANDMMPEQVGEILTKVMFIKTIFEELLLAVVLFVHAFLAGWHWFAVLCWFLLLVNAFLKCLWKCARENYKMHIRKSQYHQVERIENGPHYHMIHFFSRSLSLLMCIWAMCESRFILIRVKVWKEAIDMDAYGIVFNSAIFIFAAYLCPFLLFGHYKCFMDGMAAREKGWTKLNIIGVRRARKNRAENPVAIPDNQLVLQMINSMS